MRIAVVRIRSWAFGLSASQFVLMPSHLSARASGEILRVEGARNTIAEGHANRAEKIPVTYTHGSISHVLLRSGFYEVRWNTFVL